MPKSITKEEAAWLVVRTSGVIFAWLAITKFAGFLYAAHLLTTTGLSEIRESFSDTLSWELAWPHAFKFVVYGMLAFYLLRHGDFVHRQLRRGPRSAKSGANEQVSNNEDAEQAVGLDAG